MFVVAEVARSSKTRFRCMLQKVVSRKSSPLLCNSRFNHLLGSVAYSPDPRGPLAALAALAALGALAGCDADPVAEVPRPAPVCAEYDTHLDVPAGVGACRLGYDVCLQGAWTWLSYTQPQPEVCNGLDDDCDGTTDEGLGVAYIYPEDLYPGTVGVGECRPGIETCANGVPTTVPPVVPITAAAVCGGPPRDQDCDGATDKPKDGPGRAYALVVDVSGSMAGRLGVLTARVCQWAGEAAHAGDRYSVTPIGVWGGVGEVGPWVDAGGACWSLVALSGGVPGSEEPQLAGVLEATSQAWPPDYDRMVTVFTDEQRQSTGAELTAVLDGCVRQSYSVGALVLPSHAPQWSGIVGACGGFVADIDTAQLDEVMPAGCQ